MKGSKISETIHQLSLKDTKIIVVDLKDETPPKKSHAMFKQFEQVKTTSCNDLQFICFMTHGNYYTFNDLVFKDKESLQEIIDQILEQEK